MKIKLILFILLMFIFSKTQVLAHENSSKSSAFFASEADNAVEDKRVEKLRAYLNTYNSPLTPSAKTFVEEADKYNIDWRMVAAISGVESTFGHAIPAYSYNAWGWGVYGGKVTRFASWDDGIKTISQGIRERYMDQRGARNTYEIGATYAASTTWAQRVEFYMDRIANYTPLDPSTGLSISL